ncbi:tRNA A64-2'-O-ribosylphosphate transferase, variant 2 [Entomophthora muscae]|uniref:tRNA A64-2'-O-ribosylphosphate transferase, variant 2 n=1 Tax=Entomophthora muscae TaxID=34485 RepID=A0ACC2SIA6_9FUNG|nr:tRNA A64-2'-O-ribosylphosphate transferase, variant 2 [Entomophthora muscae]
MLSIPEGKKGQGQLSLALPKVVAWVRENAGGFIERKPRILCHCAQGVDRSVGVALTLLVEFLDETGTLNFNRTRPKVDKATIQRQLLSMTRYRSQVTYLQHKI